MAGLLSWAITFFILAIIAGLVGLRGIAGITMAIARWFVILFIVLAVLTFVI